jgi:hypothetical protein
LQSITSLKILLGDRLLYDGKRLCTRCDFQHYEVLESATSCVKLVLKVQFSVRLKTHNGTISMEIEARVPVV